MAFQTPTEQIAELRALIEHMQKDLDALKRANETLKVTLAQPSPPIAPEAGKKGGDD